MNTRKISPGSKHGIALPIVRIDGADYNLETMSVDELQELKLHIDSASVAIAFQTESASAKFNTTGERSDSEWFLDAKRAKRLKGLQSQAIQAELGRRKKLSSAKRIDQHFIDAAREMLKPPVFDAIMNEAKRRQSIANVLDQEQLVDSHREALGVTEK